MRSLLLVALVAAAPVVAPPIDRSPAAARAVVQRYYAAIDHRDYRTAYRLWHRPGDGLAAFTRGFARTARTMARTGAPTDGEGAAGSVYVTVPVSVEARLTDGTRQHFAGSYILRRVDDVPGASPDQLRWHIASASLKPVR